MQNNFQYISAFFTILLLVTTCFKLKFTEYNPPTPPKGVGYHRYILAAFGHAEPFNLEEKITQRCGFKIDFFTKTHNLHPDANNMFQTITK